MTSWRRECDWDPTVSEFVARILLGQVRLGSNCRAEKIVECYGGISGGVQLAAAHSGRRQVARRMLLRPARIAYPNITSDRDDYAVMHDGKIVGRVVKVSLSGNEQRWTWSFNRQTGNGYERGETATREEAMTAFRQA